MVADGMGGHNAGEVAARLAVDAVLDFVARRRRTSAGPSAIDPRCLKRATCSARPCTSPTCRSSKGAAVPAYARHGHDDRRGAGGRRPADGRRTSATAGCIGWRRAAAPADSDDSWMAAMLASDPSPTPPARAPSDAARVDQCRRLPAGAESMSSKSRSPPAISCC